MTFIENSHKSNLSETESQMLFNKFRTFAP